MLDEGTVKAILGVTDPVLAYVSDAALFGEIAGKPEFIGLQRGAMEKVRNFVK